MTDQELRKSRLELYSLGIVTEDKEQSSWFIKVYPVEEITLTNGDIGAAKVKYDANVPNAKGVKKSTKVDSTLSLRAKWMQGDACNRATPPNVVKNETVCIYRYADTDEYYWTTLFFEPGIRRREQVIYMYGNLKAPLAAWDKNSSYWLEVNTIDKKVQFHTSKSDGEPFEYDFTLDTARGTFLIKDTAGNSALLESAKGKWTWTAREEHVFNSKKHTINTEVYTNNAKTSATTNTKDLTDKVINSIKISATTIASNVSSSVTYQTPSFNANSPQGGRLGYDGAAAHMGGNSMSIIGQTDISGSLQVSGSVDAGGRIHGSNIW